jgi:hypothetical protein
MQRPPGGAFSQASVTAIYSSQNKRNLLMFTVCKIYTVDQRNYLEISSNIKKRIVFIT